MTYWKLSEFPLAVQPSGTKSWYFIFQAVLSEELVMVFDLILRTGPRAVVVDVVVTSSSTIGADASSFPVAVGTARAAVDVISQMLRWMS